MFNTKGLKVQTYIKLQKLLILMKEGCDTDYTRKTTKVATGCLH